jgi:radical SAM/Cys-rich protein
VEASPKRTEKMNWETAERIIYLLEKSPSIKTVDLTGGAPELNSFFKPLVFKSRYLGKEVIDRCNLTVFFEPGQEETPFFLKENGVRIIASLPCYLEENVDKQRGKEVFLKSIRALRLLNSLGYGSPDLILDLVFNPSGPNLPPSQEILEEKYKKELWENFGIKFNKLFTITNMPIKRFLQDLRKNHNYDDYMELLISNFNPDTTKTLMCRSLISVGYDGKIYDCDFNQMLDMKRIYNIWDISSFEEISDDPISFANHCFGCTAGSGSSCTGSLT